MIVEQQSWQSEMVSNGKDMELNVVAAQNGNVVFAKQYRLNNEDLADVFARPSDKHSLKHRLHRLLHKGTGKARRTTRKNKKHRRRSYHKKQK